jgi:hypothetical protein
MESSERAAFFGVFCCSLLVAACAAPARTEEMIPGNFDVASRHGGSITVSGDGGKATSGWGYSEIGTDEFVQAVVAALQSSMVFASVQGRQADYRLHVVLGEVGAVPSDREQTARVTATWTLTDRVGTKLLDETITATGSATLGDAFVGTKRLQIMKERAARANIRLGIERLAKLEL